ncbi:hypothetical protein HanIR_Chr16g0809391 [Helianthus annuus]|nr:hypothetical protein HanIR_Chr16g0809391 [Helianthus annuus]
MSSLCTSSPLVRNPNPKTKENTDIICLLSRLLLTNNTHNQTATCSPLVSLLRLRRSEWRRLTGRSFADEPLTSQTPLYPNPLPPPEITERESERQKIEGGAAAHSGGRGGDGGAFVQRVSDSVQVSYRPTLTSVQDSVTPSRLGQTRVHSGQQTVNEVNGGQTVKLVNSGQQVSLDSITVQLVSVMVQDWFEWVNWFRFGFRVNTSTGQTLVNDSQLSGQRRSTQDPEYYRCALATSHSWNDTTESRKASFAQEYQGCIFKTKERLE